VQRKKKNTQTPVFPQQEKSPDFTTSMREYLCYIPQHDHWSQRVSERETEGQQVLLE